MAKKYKAKRKSVQKMTRDGLVEEHLSDAEVSEAVREPPGRAAPVRTKSRASDYAEGSFERI
ncbi:MAG: hypothetical protein HUJ72_01755, partial [Blautia sp.]|nr:hypothetical protein [Blautia sp.]